MRRNAGRRIRRRNAVLRRTNPAGDGFLVVHDPRDTFGEIGSQPGAVVEFADYAWLGADLAEGISWVMRNQESIAGRIRAAQDRIAAAYSPDSIAAQWERILEMA